MRYEYFLLYNLYTFRWQKLKCPVVQHLIKKKGKSFAAIK